MRLLPIPKRALQNVGSDIWKAIEVIEAMGGELTHDSNHDPSAGEEATTWIFTFPDRGSAQVAVPMNKQKLVVFMRERLPGGAVWTERAARSVVVEKRYTNSEKGVASSLLGRHAPDLNPSGTSPLLRIKLDPTQVRDLLVAYLDRPGAGSAPATGVQAAAPESAPVPNPPTPPVLRQARQVTAAELLAQLDRNAETGQAGELVAVLYELQRLAVAGCPNPQAFVHRVSLTDVGRGYDIDSTWPGEERCIEVKSTTRRGSDIYLSANELEVLEALADKAWLYRVLVDADGSGSVIGQPIKNPVPALRTAGLTVAVWRAREPVSTE